MATPSPSVAPPHPSLTSPPSPLSSSQIGDVLNTTAATVDRKYSDFTTLADVPETPEDLRRGRSSSPEASSPAVVAQPGLVRTKVMVAAHVE